MTVTYWKPGMILVVPLLLDETVGPEFVSKFRKRQSE